MRTGDDEDEIRRHLTQLARELQPLPAPPPMAPFVEASPAARKEEEDSEVEFVEERRVERCRCRVVGKGLCEADVASFEGCAEGEECGGRERAHTDDLQAAGVMWCRAFLVTGVSAGRSEDMGAYILIAIIDLEFNVLVSVAWSRITRSSSRTRL